MKDKRERNELIAKCEAAGLATVEGWLTNRNLEHWEKINAWAVTKRAEERQLTRVIAWLALGASAVSAMFAALAYFMK